jgi:hypothetical protein
MPQLFIKMGLLSDENDMPLNFYFDENGFQSRAFLENIGSTFIFIVIYIFAWLLNGIIYFAEYLLKR